MALDPTTQRNIDTWLNGNYDEDTKAHFRALVDAGDDTALTNAFYRHLEY